MGTEVPSPLLEINGPVHGEISFASFKVRYVSIISHLFLAKFEKSKVKNALIH